jgi:hypothetical protein
MLVSHIRFFVRLSTISNSILLYPVFIVQAYQTSQYVVPRGGIFLGKWRSSFAGSSDGKMKVQSPCALNTRYIRPCAQQFVCFWHVHDGKLKNTRISIISAYLSVSNKSRTIETDFYYWPGTRRLGFDSRQGQEIFL